MLERLTCAVFRGPFTAKSSRQVERMRCRESSEAHARELSPENEVLTLKKTIPWQRFAATAKT